MNCREIQALLEAYLDGELDPARSREIDVHTRGCAGCAAVLETHRKLSSAVAAAEYYPASTPLRARVESQASQAARRARRPAPWLALAAGVALAVLLLPKLLSPDPMAKEVVRAHLRSLQAGPLVDVSAAGRHALKPFLAAKLDFALDVEDISARGFALDGGRADSLAGRTVAALVYRRGPHVINVFVWPAAEKADRLPAGQALDGFQVVNWQTDGMNWWAVSDLDLSELEQLPMCPCFLPVHETLRS